jgi:hypothetical protein
MPIGRKSARKDTSAIPDFAGQTSGCFAMEQFATWVGWLLAALAVFYFGAPLVIWAVHRMPAHPRFTAVEFNELDDTTAATLLAQIRSLHGIGFDEPIAVRMPNPVPNLSAYLVMLVNRMSGDEALVTAIFNTAGSAQTLATHYVEFNTRFETGEVFDTLNSKTLNSFLPGPKTVRTQTPTVTDPQELFRLHHFVMRKCGASGRRIVFPVGQGLDYLTSTIVTEACNHQVNHGRMYYEAASDAYRPTLKGAYLMTWGELHPFKAIRRITLRRAERQILEESAHTDGQ